MDNNRKALLRKQSKELKKELKDIKRRLFQAGCNKQYIGQWLKEFRETLEHGALERAAYEEAGMHLMQAREMIRRLLAGTQSKLPQEIYDHLSVLAEHLERMYHDCLIREDDLDFKSTSGSLNQMIILLAEADSSGRIAGKKSGRRKKDSLESTAALQGAVEAGMSDIMLRSELENIKAVLDDVAEWSAPDFFALAYYFLHGKKEMLKEMENEQRNMYLAAYTGEHFLNQFFEECGRVGASDIPGRTLELISKYV